MSSNAPGLAMDLPETPIQLVHIDVRNIDIHNSWLFLIDKGSFLLRHYQYQEIYGLFVAPKWVVLQLKPLEHHGFQPGIWTWDARQTTPNIRTDRCRQVCGLTKKVQHHFAHFVHLGAMEWGDSPVHMHFKAQNAAGGYQPTNLKR